MSQIRQQQAYERGARTAHLWKKFKDSVLHWDRRCTAWVNKKNLPSWIGHAPVVVALLGSLTAILVGGAIVAGCLLFIWAMALIFQQISLTNYQGNDTDYFDSVTNSEPLTEYRDGDQGYGLYCGSYRMDQDDD